MKLSPMMQQYMEIKEQHKDAILFFRLGDFYEMFYDDALLASKELELTLTGKNCGQEEKAPMCGVPFHAVDSYIAKLVEKGYKVAICEQTEDPATAKGIVKRDVIKIVTPGTITLGSGLAEKENNYLACVYTDAGKTMGISYCDVSTGQLFATEYSGRGRYDTIVNELVKIKPSEIIFSQSFSEEYQIDEIKNITGAFINVLDESYFSEKGCEELITAQFNCIGLTALGLDFRPTCVRALGALLGYLRETQMQSLKHIRRVNLYEIGSHMALDKATIRNLEITETLYEKKVQGSLLGILDKTHTAMGSRMMRSWLREPLNDAEQINYRLDGVAELFDDVTARSRIKESLKQIYDFERLTARVACGGANGKDLIALKSSIARLPEIKTALSGFDSEILRDIDSKILDLSDVYGIIDRAIVEDPPFTIKEGELIKDGYSEELDALKASISGAKTWISSLEESERERTGIKNLKVGYNRVFGYYLEVTRSYYDLIPENYIRKQTLANCERFITAELKQAESLVLTAQEKINKMEYELFLEVREFIEGYIDQIQTTSEAVAMLDALTSFAHVSDRLGYVRPAIDDSLEIEIIRGRHPVIEQTSRGGLFVSNNTYLNNTDSSLALITGPNMAGKSTYMRQTALIVLMAQAGCFVPCERARIGVCDRIFTRIGASDNLSQGQSTFYVEMSELSYILNNASERSLIILDEIGRGTSTYDGLSIAWAAAEYLCNDKRKVRTLFATHYHELTELADTQSGIRNLSVDVAEENGNIVFLHKIVDGPASRSYGIHVAKLAGVPSQLLTRAKEKLAELESSTPAEGQISMFGYGLGLVAEPKHSMMVDEPKEPEKPAQPAISDELSEALDKLRGVDLMDVTASKALAILEELKKVADTEEI